MSGRRALALLLALVGVGIVLWVSWRDREAPPSAAARAGSRAPISGATDPLVLEAIPARVVAKPAAAPLASRQASAKGTSRASLEVSVLHAEDRRPFPFAGIRLNFLRVEDPVEIQADRNGRFQTFIDVSEELVLVDALSADGNSSLVRCATSTTMGKTLRVDVKPELTVNLTLEMAETMPIHGIVVDENGVPLRDAKIEVFQLSPSGYLGPTLQILTPESGRFELSALSHCDQLLEPQIAAHISRVRVTLAPRRPRQFDVRLLTEAERMDWRVVLPEGHRVSGRLLDTSGRPLGDVPILLQGDRSFGESSDNDGRFTLEDVGGGERTLGAYVLEGDLEARRVLVVSGDMDDVALVARPIDLSATPGATNVLGLRVVEVDEATRRARDFPPQARVMVVDAGVVGTCFKSSWPMTPGTGIAMIGHSVVTDIRSLLDLLIAAAEEANEMRTMSFPVVTTHGSLKGPFSDYFSLDRPQLEWLKRLRATMR